VGYAAGICQFRRRMMGIMIAITIIINMALNAGALGAGWFFAAVFAQVPA